MCVCLTPKYICFSRGPADVCGMPREGGCAVEAEAGGHSKFIWLGSPLCWDVRAPCTRASLLDFQGCVTRYSALQ